MAVRMCSLYLTLTATLVALRGQASIEEERARRREGVLHSFVQALPGSHQGLLDHRSVVHVVKGGVGRIAIKVQDEGSLLALYL